MKRFVLALILFCSCGAPTEPNSIELGTLPLQTSGSAPLIQLPAIVTETAVRSSTTIELVPVVTEPIVAITDPPAAIYAPEGLSDCDEMQWYRIDAGLPERFDALGWRESNCRNEDGVHTSCCHGYWQMWTALHMKDHRLAPKMSECGVSTYEDLNSDTPEDKKRQACAAKALYDVVGYSAWDL